MPSADFVSDLRARLMAEADTALLPQAARPLTAEEQRLVLPVRSYRRDRRLATVLAAAALIGATTSMAVAAQTALPGESLYSVKRAIENTQTDVARGDTAKGRALLANARGRLDEVRELAERGDPASVSAVESTLEAFTDQADEASDVLLAAYDETGDEAVITELRSFTGSSMDRLAALESSLPATAREELVAAGARLAEIDRQASRRARRAVATSPRSRPTCSPAATSRRGVTTVIMAASENPGLLKPVEERPEPTPSGLPGPGLRARTSPGSRCPTSRCRTRRPPPRHPRHRQPRPASRPRRDKVDVKTPVNEATKLLTGDLSTATDGPAGRRPGR